MTLLKLHSSGLSEVTATEVLAPATLEQNLNGETTPVLEIPHDTDLSTVAVNLSGVETILLHFPIYRDGRAFTQARILRERFEFKGEIRATGDVARDQALYMVRCGFDGFVLPENETLEGFTEALGEFTQFYQAATDGIAPVWQLRQAARVAISA